MRQSSVIQGRESVFSEAGSESDRGIIARAGTEGFVWAHSIERAGSLYFTP